MLTLKELVDRCLTKDKAAWNEFVLEFKSVVEKSVRARLARHNFLYTIEDVKDITQNIFLDIWESNRLEQVRSEDKLTAWMAIVAQNAAVDFMRSSRKFLRQEPDIVDEEGNRKDLIESIASNCDPLKEMTNSELSEVLDTLIGALEPRDRLILQLNILHGLSHREISELLRIPINTASTIIRRCLLKLQDSLSRRGYKDF